MAALKAAYERRASQHVLAGELGKTGNAAAGNELWRVPPPPMLEDAEREGGVQSPNALRRAEVCTRPSDNQHNSASTLLMFIVRGEGVELYSPHEVPCDAHFLVRATWSKRTPCLFALPASPNLPCPVRQCSNKTFRWGARRRPQIGDGRHRRGSPVAGGLAQTR